MTTAEDLEISESEAKAIEDLKNKFLNELDENQRKDTYMFYRFLKAHDFNLFRAEANLRKTLQWRKQQQVDTILTDYSPSPFIEKYFGKTRFAIDNRGGVVHYFPLGRIDTKGLYMSAKPSEIEKFYIKMMEEDDKRTKPKRVTSGGSYPVTVFIFDVDGITFANATHKKGIETLIQSFKILDNYYPGRSEAFVINITPLFAFPCSIIKGYLSSSLLDKVQFFGASGWQEELLKIIDIDQLPGFLGGEKTDPDGNPSCKTFMNHGGKVEEKYYMQQTKKKLATVNGISKLILYRASFSEINITVEEPDSLIEWEFETKTRDIGFGLFRKEIVEGEEQITELVPLMRIDTEDYSETGMFKCEKAGTYVMLFDNSYSWIRSKEIYYRTKIIKPKEHEAQMK